MGPWAGSANELFMIKKHTTGTHSTEVHVLTSASKYRGYALETGTPLSETNKTFTYLLGDWDGDGITDLWIIKKSGTGTGKTELHVLSGASNFQRWLFEGGTALPMTDDGFSFCLYPKDNGRPDLAAIKRNNTGTRTTEVHILSAESNYTAYRLETGTALEETGTKDDWHFSFVDYNHDGIPDLCMITVGVQNGEFHVISGKDYHVFLAHIVVNTPERAKTTFGITDDQNEALVAVVTLITGVGAFVAASPIVVASFVLAGLTFGVWEVERVIEKIFGSKQDPSTGRVVPAFPPGRGWSGEHDVDNPAPAEPGGDGPPDPDSGDDHGTLPPMEIHPPDPGGGDDHEGGGGEEHGGDALLGESGRIHLGLDDSPKDSIKSTIDRHAVLTNTEADPASIIRALGEACKEIVIAMRQDK